MFAYCQSNPVMYYDSTGTRFVQAKIIGGGGDDTSGNSQSNAGRSITYQNKNPKPKSKLKEDIENFDLFNTDEQKVIDANYFSIYKGIPYIIVPNQGWGFSIGAVFFGENIKNKELVKHEYGHTVQFRNNNFGEYMAKVIIPSVIAFWIKENTKMITDENYYKLPWEAEANRFGGRNFNEKE